MTLAETKQYLSTRIQAEELLSLEDCKIEKYMITAINILDVYYHTEQIKDDVNRCKIISEEMIFLFNSNIDLNLFYEYNGLTSFNIAGAIAGAVDYSVKGDILSPYVKGILQSLGIEEKIALPGAKVTNSFTWL